MNIIDILILSGLFSGGVLGSRNGVIKQAVVLLGTIICFIFAFVLKNPIANFLSYNFPFFSFGGLTSLNIVFYQLLAFILLLGIFSLILTIIIKISGGVETVLKYTVILSIPSKILGFVLGLLEALIIIFVLLFILQGTVINKETNLINTSKFAPVILNSSPGLSNISSDINESINDITNIVKNYDEKNSNKFNKDVTNTLLKHNVIDNNYLNNLRNKGKINY